MRFRACFGMKKVSAFFHYKGFIFGPQEPLKAF